MLRQHIETATTIGIGVMSAVVIWSNLLGSPTRTNAEPPLPSLPVSLGDAVMGSPTAPLAMVAFSDFECSYCGVFARETWPVLQERYVVPGRLQVAFRHFPNERIHSNSVYAAEVAVCAGKQDRFWQVHDLLFGANAALDRQAVDRALTTFDLDRAHLEKCIASDAESIVNADLADAIELGLTGTPAFLMGTRLANGSIRVARRISGAQPVEVFSRAVEALLATSPETR